DVQGLEDSDQIGHSRERVGVEGVVRVSLELIEGACGHAAEQVPGGFLRNLPLFENVEKCPNRRRAQPLACRSAAQVYGRRGMVTSLRMAGAVHGLFSYSFALY